MIYTAIENDIASEGEENHARRTSLKKTACISNIHPPAEKDTMYIACSRAE